MGKREIHPEKILFWLLTILLLVDFTLLTAAFATGERAYRSWALGAVAFTVLLGSAPLIGFLAFEAVEKLRGGRRD